ncbi:MAG: hypothetical protein ACP5I1_20095 [Candidatus Hinthialibacter sp.]
MNSESHATGCGCGRRTFMAAMGTSLSSLAFHPIMAQSETEAEARRSRSKEPAKIIGAFLYPPSSTLRVEGGWWSWPGNDFDAENRQKQYVKEMREIEKRLNIQLEIIDPPIDSEKSADQFIARVKQSNPDGILLIPFFNGYFNLLDRILNATTPDAENAIPAIVYCCLGVHHGSIVKYQRKGIHYIQSLDNMEALEYGLNMIRVRKFMKNSRIISVAGAEDGTEAVVPFWGTTVRRVSLRRFEDEVNKTEINEEVKKLAGEFKKNATKILEPADPEILQAARVHFANKRILKEEEGDALMMDCLRRGELMPCMSFMTLRDEGIAAGCENDLGPTLTLMLVQELFNRPGFQHNPCFETELNHYFASHCTSASKLFGIDKPPENYLLRNYGHTNDPTCCPQVLFREGEEVTMARCIPAEEPQMLLYSGKVVKSYGMPPVGGCRTNVEITIHELENACEVKGHHNVLFYGNYADRLKQFNRFYGIQTLV